MCKSDFKLILLITVISRDALVRVPLNTPYTLSICLLHFYAFVFCVLLFKEAHILKQILRWNEFNQVSECKWVIYSHAWAILWCIAVCYLKYISVYSAISTFKRSLSLIMILGKNIISVMTDRMTSGTSRESQIFPVKKKIRWCLRQVSEKIFPESLHSLQTELTGNTFTEISHPFRAKILTWLSKCNVECT